MSQRILTALLLATLLGGCDGNPFANANLAGGVDGGDSDGGSIGGPGVGGGGTNTGTTPIDDDISVNVEAVSYTGSTLLMQVDGLDSTGASGLVPFQPYNALNVPGYQAYRVQEDALDRMFVALAAQSQDGATRAVAVADGGQFQHYFGGAYYERTGGFDAPAIGTGPGAGQVSYAGDYAGVTNLGVPGNPDALPVTPGTSPSVIPRQPARVSGDVLLNVNFQDNVVNGTIYNRVIVDVGFSLDDVILIPADILADGTFHGTVEGEAPDESDVAGEYGGIFGGTDSSSVAGAVHLTEFEGDFDAEQEHGIFVLTECSLQVGNPICDQVAP